MKGELTLIPTESKHLMCEMIKSKGSRMTSPERIIISYSFKVKEDVTSPKS